MSVNLQKGQKVDLTKGNAGLKRIIIGLGWDEASKLNKGGAIDCDASAILCGPGEKVYSKDDVVYFGNLRHKNGAVNHQGDNLTGAGDGDDEQITVDLPLIPANYEKIVFVVNIYKAQERRQHFGLIENAFIRIVDASTNTELLKYNLSENYGGLTAMIFGELYRHGGEWKFSAIGQGTQDAGIGELAHRYGL
ncbi:stress response protein SCP2 [Clostridia bacterium]|nr:stress response protein SCP2 [Clostridia bacterium]